MKAILMSFLWLVSFALMALGTFVFAEVAICPNERYVPCPLWVRLACGWMALGGLFGLLGMLRDWFKFRRTAFKAVAIVALALAVGVAAEASTCRVVRSRQVVVQEAAVVAAVFAPIPVAVPAYSVGVGQDLTPLLEELRAMRQELQQMRLGGAAPKTEATFVSLVRANCAACHGVTPKGNKLSLFHPNGTWKEPSPELLGDLIAMTASGRMPKDRKMSAEDRLALITGLTTAPAQAEQLKAPPSKGPAPENPY